MPAGFGPSRQHEHWQLAAQDMAILDRYHEAFGHTLHGAPQPVPAGILQLTS